MLTVDFDQLSLIEGDRLLDLGCGSGRHTFEALRRGAQVVALDRNADELDEVEATVAAMAAAGEITAPPAPVTLRGDALALPFEDGHFDRVIAAEVLEHIDDDRSAIAEIARVTRPGGMVAVTVPRWWPEKVSWFLSEEYHSAEGGHLRVYRGTELVEALRAAGLQPLHSHHAHALHSPYWWLKCSIGDNGVTRAYHRMLVWDIVKHPWLTTTADRLLNPYLGKSLVLYVRKPYLP